MKTTSAGLRLAGAVTFLLAATMVHAQTAAPPSVVPEDGISDIGAIQQVPYSITGAVVLRLEEKAILRKMEDKHIQELRSLEDRYERDLRVLRAKQYAERDAALKSFMAKR